jgi:hypothetical protein
LYKILEEDIEENYGKMEEKDLNQMISLLSSGRNASLSSSKDY